MQADLTESGYACFRLRHQRRLSAYLRRVRWSREQRDERERDILAMAWVVCQDLGVPPDGEWVFVVNEARARCREWSRETREVRLGSLDLADRHDPGDEPSWCPSLLAWIINQLPRLSVKQRAAVHRRLAGGGGCLVYGTSASASRLSAAEGIRCNGGAHWVVVGPE
jgi:hypothetical protein